MSGSRRPRWLGWSTNWWRTPTLTVASWTDLIGILYPWSIRMATSTRTRLTGCGAKRDATIRPTWSAPALANSASTRTTSSVSAPISTAISSSTGVKVAVPAMCAHRPLLASSRSASRNPALWLISCSNRWVWVFYFFFTQHLTTKRLLISDFLLLYSVPNWPCTCRSILIPKCGCYRGALPKRDQKILANCKELRQFRKKNRKYFEKIIFSSKNAFDSFN